MVCAADGMARREPAERVFYLPRKSLVKLTPFSRRAGEGIIFFQEDRIVILITAFFCY